MKVKFISKQTLRIKGIPTVFEYGNIYDVDESLRPLEMDDGFGRRYFEEYREKEPLKGPVPTPEEVHEETREKRQEEFETQRKLAIQTRIEEAKEMEVSRRVDSEEPTTQTSSPKLNSKIAARLGKH